MLKTAFLLLPFFVFCSCSYLAENKGQENSNNLAVDSISKKIVYTQFSDLENSYIGFNSPKAINQIAQMENDHLKNFRASVSKYYGTSWYEAAVSKYSFNDSVNDFDFYVRELALKHQKPDSLHCTLYAVKALEAGMDSNYRELQNYHKKIWKNREFAGWSVGYILTKYYNWRAYLVVSNYSTEAKDCRKNFKKDKKYHVWKQPDIPVEEIYDFENDHVKIDSLLKLNEFGWGFSKQGWHTWITRFDTLKECNWLGAPSLKHDDFSMDLFSKTKFTEYQDFRSHILIFPPKKET